METFFEEAKRMHMANLKNLLVACVFLSVIVCPVAGRIIYVNDDATGFNDGTSWQNAYTDLQSALSTSGFGDWIWVAAGTYKPGTFPNDSFSMERDLAIYGGFPNSGDPNMADRDWCGNPTILSGDIGVEGNNLDNCRHVFYHPEMLHLDSSAVLDGFTITAGYSTYTDGAGMYNADCSPTISNCTFVGNTAVNGGGIYNTSSSSPILTNCTFYNNTATTNGGGICNTGTLLISSPVLTNCTFYNNTAATYGGGIYNELFCASTITNCILWGDTAGTAGNEIHGGSVATYSDVDGGTGQSWFGVGCIDSDPCFVDAASGDFHLLITSPCINAGSNNASDLPTVDFEGDMRIMFGTVDIGADEWMGFSLTTVIEPEGAGWVTLIPPGGHYFPGTVVTVRANDAGGYAFDHWSGDLTGSNNPETITMDSDLTVTAHFNYVLSITLAPLDGGSVTGAELPLRLLQR
jgi:uncharacterized repeat protein (TIGR02543 family)